MGEYVREDHIRTGKIRCGSDVKRVLALSKGLQKGADNGHSSMASVRVSQSWWRDAL